MTRRLVIVGAGVIGSMIGLRASDDPGIDEIVLVDMGLHPTGASLYSAGVHFPYASNAVTREYSTYSENKLSELAIDEANDWYRTLDMTVAIHSDDMLDDNLFTEAMVSEAAKLGSLEQYFDNRVDLHKYPGAHVADVPTLIRSLRSKLQSRTRIVHGLKCIGFDSHGEDLHIHFSTGDKLVADAAVFAPGPWACMPPFNLFSNEFNIRTKRVVALHIDAEPTWSDPLVFMPVPDAFLLPQPEFKRWLFSYTSNEWDEDPNVMGDGVNERDVRCGKNVLSKFAPQLVSHISAGRVFCDAYSADRIPVVNHLPNNERAIFAGAANGSGYRFSPAIANKALDCVNEAMK